MRNSSLWPSLRMAPPPHQLWELLLPTLHRLVLSQWSLELQLQQILLNLLLPLGLPDPDKVLAVLVNANASAELLLILPDGVSTTMEVCQVICRPHGQVLV